MTAHDFTVADLFNTAANNIAESQVSLEFNVLSEFKAELEMEMSEDTAPEVIYTRDAFAVSQDAELAAMLNSQDVEEAVVGFEGCATASQCVEREANAIVDLAYQLVRNELFDDLAEAYDSLTDQKCLGYNGKEYIAVQGMVEVGDFDLSDASSFDAKTTDNGRAYTMYFSDSAKVFYAELLHSGTAPNPVSIIIKLTAEESEA